ncbi:hypothetical protein LSTR_LSTR010417 [Laodelphax striatellus]|uniref:Uncharacterized protein n=1 Tax=Laodelphax striatellus TaxID=195883 RepID=A0A482XII0_LAOST|nr:hypothetical protein LSTR_LSTR010417 [Laodelphax striatellus]
MTSSPEVSPELPARTFDPIKDYMSVTPQPPPTYSAAASPPPQSIYVTFLDPLKCGGGAAAAAGDVDYRTMLYGGAVVGEWLLAVDGRSELAWVYPPPTLSSSKHQHFVISVLNSS